MQTKSLRPMSIEMNPSIPQARLEDLPGLALKRGFDLLMSALGLLILAPLFGLLAILIQRDSPGPVFFKGRRVGKNGKLFDILKFRSMREEPASYLGPHLTACHDNRITAIGHWLRNTKLNELPQLWNVLVGQMSLVGPRPEDPEMVAAWPEAARREILALRPGITSPASVAYHDEEKRLDGSNLLGNYLEKIAPDKVRLDQLYVRHRSFLTDLDAIFWTLVVLLPRIAKQPETEGLLFGGPFTRFAQPYLSQTLGDLLISISAIGIVGLIWRSAAPLQFGWEMALMIALSFALQFGLVNSLLGLKRVEWSRAAAEDVYMLLLSGLLVLISSMLLDLAIPAVNIPDGFLVDASILTVLGFIVTRYRLRLVTGLAAGWVRRRGYGVGERVLVVGAGAGGEIAAWLLRRPDFRHLFKVVGFVDDAPGLQGRRFDGISVLGTTADIPSLVKKEDVGMLCFAIGKGTPQDRQRIIDRCCQSGARLVILAEVLQSLEQHFFHQTAEQARTEH